MIVINTVKDGNGYIIKEDPITYGGSTCVVYLYESYVDGVMIKTDSLINIHDAIAKAKEAIKNA